MLQPGTLENSVLVGNDGYLFLAEGHHHVLDIVTGNLEVTDASFDAFRDNISQRIAWAEANRTQFLHLIVPDKQSIAPQFWPLSPPLKLGDEYIKRSGGLAEFIFYPIHQLSEHKDQAISRVDTHLRDYGSILLASLLVEKFSGTNQANNFNELTRHIASGGPIDGDLGSKLTPAILDHSEFFNYQIPGEEFCNNIEGANNGGIDLRFNSEAFYNKRIIMFGDSFGRDICRFLQFWYSEVFFFRTGYFHEEIAELCKPDILITENIERYMNDCTSNDEHPQFLLYPLMHGREYTPSGKFLEALNAVLSFPRKPYIDFVGPLLPQRRIPVPLLAESLSLPGVHQFDSLALTDCPDDEGLLMVLEEEELVRQLQPVFVANFSDREFAPITHDEQDIHGSYLVRRENSLLFGANHLVSADGHWSCEGRAFKQQFLDLVKEPYYELMFPGPKPVVESRGDSLVLRTSHLLPEQVEQIQEPLFLATPLEPTTWGRWIATVVPKAIQYLRLGGGRRFFCAVREPWQRRFLNLCGVSDDLILDHDPGKTYICRDVMTIEYSITNMTISKAEREIYFDLAKLHFRPRLGNRKLFISRLSISRQHPNIRVLQNEADLCSAISTLGFTIVEPETLTIEEQISLYASAEYIVSLGGSALYNMVFCSPGTRVVTIESSDDFISPHTQLLSSLGLPYAVIFGLQDPTDDSPSHKRWTIDIDRTIAKIEEFSPSAPEASSGAAGLSAVLARGDIFNERLEVHESRMTMFAGSLDDARLLVSVPLLFRPARLEYFLDQVRCLSELGVDLVDLRIVTNTFDDADKSTIMDLIAPFRSSRFRVSIESFWNPEEPKEMTWVHKAMIRDIFLRSPDLTHFIYLEDDIRFSRRNLRYFIENRDYLGREGFIPGFIRYEFNLSTFKLYLSDITEPMGLGDNVLHIGDKSFVMAANPYCAAFVLDQQLAEEYVMTDSFDPERSMQTGWPSTERSAMGLCFEHVPPGHISRFKVLVDLEKNIPDAGCLIHHLPNNFTNRDWPADHFQFGKTELMKIFSGG